MDLIQKSTREKIVFILPFIQIIIATITLIRLPQPPPQYFCQQVAPNLVVCNNNPIHNMPL
jgi:hypothetical protein